MLSLVRDEIDKALFINQINKINEVFENQARLPKEARIGPSVIEKLEELYQFLEVEIWKYDQINDAEEAPVQKNK